MTKPRFYRTALLAGIMSLVVGTTPLTAAPAKVAARTGAYTYSGPGTVNTHWIETPNGGLIVIDVQRDLTHARAALAAVKALGRPVRAILITHGHPDHYAGIGVFKAAYPDAVVWSSQTTFDTIKDDPYQFNALMHRVAPNDTPETFTLPDRVFAKDAKLEIDGTTVVTCEFGKAEANGATVYFFPASGDLYVGDLVLNRLHALFGEAATTEWLAALDRIDLIYPATAIIHPGHGVTGPKAKLLADERDYIVTTRRLAVGELAKSGATPEAEARVVAAVKRRYPFENPAGLRDIVSISVHAMFEEFGKPELAPVK